MALTTNYQSQLAILLRTRGIVLPDSSNGSLLETLQAIGDGLSRVGRGELRAKADASNQTGSEQECSREDETMYKYKFAYQGGGTRRDNMNFKFHCFIADTDATEHHLFEAKKRGLVVSEGDEDVSNPKRRTSKLAEGVISIKTDVYLSAMPIVKVFSSTSGFGIPKEYFSYFFLMNPNGDKVVRIKPLGFEQGCIPSWYFQAAGRFMTKDEIRTFFGADSDTWKFYNRQAFLSKRRINQLVDVFLNTGSGDLVEETKPQAVRMVRMD